MKPNYQRSVNAYWAILLCILFDAANILMNMYLLTLSEDELDVFNQMIGVTSILAIFNLIALILACVLFILWFRRAYYNLHEIGVGGLQYTEGWAAGGWFVPFMNLVVPFRIMKEIWRETQRAIFRNDEYQPSNLIGGWWFLWIIGNILDRIYSRMILKAETMEEINQSNILETVSSVLNIGAGILVMVIIKQLRVYENTLYDSRMNQQESILFDVAAPADDIEMDNE